MMLTAREKEVEKRVNPPLGIGMNLGPQVAQNRPMERSHPQGQSQANPWGTEPTNWILKRRTLTRLFRDPRALLIAPISVNLLQQLPPF